MDEREAMWWDVPMSGKGGGLLDNLTHLVGRTTPRVVVPQYAEIERCATRHRDGPLSDRHGLGQSPRQGAAHALHVNREDEVRIDFEALLAFGDGFLIALRQVERVSHAAIDERRQRL